MRTKPSTYTELALENARLRSTGRVSSDVGPLLGQTANAKSAVLGAGIWEVPAAQAPAHTLAALTSIDEKLVVPHDT